jgi:hypothetical protein
MMVTAVPIEFEPKTQKEPYPCNYKKTITVSKAKALASVKKYLRVRSFTGLVTTTYVSGLKFRDQWIRDWNRVYYSNRGYPGRERFVAELER